MQLFKARPTILQLQFLVWLSVLLILFFTLLPMDGPAQSAMYTALNMAFYAIVIYGNILFLFPRFYQKGRYFSYALLVIVSLVIICALREYLTLWLYNTFFATKPERFTLKAMLNFFSGGVLIFVMSFIFRIALAYFKLKQQTEEIIVQKSQAELNLLKSQVQPHFLFNTLNNIYYEAYKEAPRTAALIERLSDIMRYFVDESPRDDVAISTEVQFIENYIELEKIRIRHGVEIIFEKKYDLDLRIPPMLFMTFVENIFKHGIDKSSIQNRVNISLIQQDNYLLFKTCNNVYDAPVNNQPNGFGIANLKRRLTMLYRDNFELFVNKTDDTFTAFLKIPLT
jgi:sensor histidine kinase YesM